MNGIAQRIEPTAENPLQVIIKESQLDKIVERIR